MTTTALANSASKRTGEGAPAHGGGEQPHGDRAATARWVPYGSGFAVIADAGLLKVGARVAVRRRDGSVSTETVSQLIKTDPLEGIDYAEVERPVRWRRLDGGFALYGPADVLQEGARVQVRRSDGSVSTQTVGKRIEADVPTGMACASVRRERSSFWDRRGRFG